MPTLASWACYPAQLQFAPAHERQTNYAHTCSQSPEGSGVQIFTFDRKEWRIPNFDSVDAFATLIVHGEHSGRMRVSCLTIEPGGLIGTHPAVGGQVFLVVTGSGWVSGPDGQRHPIQAGQAVRWDEGEIHTSGTDTGLTAIAIEGPTLEIFQET